MLPDDFFARRNRPVRIANGVSPIGTPFPLMSHGFVSEVFASFQGEGAHVGERQLFVRFAICNLRCRYCDTPDSLVAVPALTIQYPEGAPVQVANPVSSADLCRVCCGFFEGCGPIDGVAVTGGEPLVQAEFVAAFLREARFPVPVLLETSGVLPEKLALVLPWVNVVSMDIKLPSNSGEPAFWTEHARFLECAGAKELYVKVLIDEGTADDEVAQAAELVAAHGDAPIFLQPIMTPGGRPDISPATLTRLFAVARRHHQRVRVVPQTHKLLHIP
jgi:organic radical activating enzyme